MESQLQHLWGEWLRGWVWNCGDSFFSFADWNSRSSGSGATPSDAVFSCKTGHLGAICAAYWLVFYSCVFFQKRFPCQRVQRLQQYVVVRGLCPFDPLVRRRMAEKTAARRKLIPYHWGRGGLETGDYMLGTFRAHVHLSHNVTSG